MWKSIGLFFALFLYALSIADANLVLRSFFSNDGGIESSRRWLLSE